MQSSYLKEEEELKCMYLRLKEMAGRLIEIEEMYPHAKEFKEVIDKAIIDLESASHLIDTEVQTLRALSWSRSLRGKKRKMPVDSSMEEN